MKDIPNNLTSALPPTSLHICLLHVTKNASREH